MLCHLRKKVTEPSAALPKRNTAISKWFFIFKSSISALSEGRKLRYFETRAHDDVHSAFPLYFRGATQGAASCLANIVYMLVFGFRFVLKKTRTDIDRNRKKDRKRKRVIGC